MAEFVDLTGQTVDRFKLIRHLGRGATADVYLAEDSTQGDYKAIKVLRSDLLQGQRSKLLQRFRQEAAAAGSLAHPNIVQYYDIGEFGDYNYIVWEFVQGRNLKEVINEDGLPSLPLVMQVMKCVALALQAAGEAGIVHRDIKPENILLTPSGEVKVADFGLAQLAQPLDGESSLTQVGTTLGTPLYMSPEQVKGRRLDHRSDLYSLGVTCYHMLTGQPPFVGATPMAVAIMHVQETPRTLKSARSELPTGLCQIVEKLMQKDPEKRYVSAVHMLQDLKKVAAVLKRREKGGSTDAASTGIPALEPMTPGDPATPPEPDSANAADASTPSNPGGGRVTGAAAEALEPIPTRPDWMPDEDATPSFRISSSRPVAGDEQVAVSAPPPPLPVDAEEEEEFSIRSASTEFEEMDLTPMVDVTFLLLIFFMITASFSIQKTIQVPAPDPDKQGAAQSVQSLEELETEAIIVEIAGDNSIIIDDEPLADVSGLAEVFSNKMINEQKNELVLEAASAALHDTVIRVIDAANEVNIERVRLVTRTEE